MVHIPHALLIQVFRRRRLEVLDTLNELDSSRRLTSDYALHELERAPCLVCFPERLWRGTRHGAIMRTGPWRRIVDGSVGRKVSGDEEEGLRATQMLLDA